MGDSPRSASVTPQDPVQAELLQFLQAMHRIALEYNQLSYVADEPKQKVSPYHFLLGAMHFMSENLDKAQLPTTWLADLDWQQQRVRFGFKRRLNQNHLDFMIETDRQFLLNTLQQYHERLRQQVATAEALPPIEAELLDALIKHATEDTIEVKKEQINAIYWEHAEHDVYMPRALAFGGGMLLTSGVIATLAAAAVTIASGGIAGLLIAGALLGWGVYELWERSNTADKAALGLDENTVAEKTRAACCDFNQAAGKYKTGLCDEQTQETEQGAVATEAVRHPVLKSEQHRTSGGGAPNAADSGAVAQQQQQAKPSADHDTGSANGTPRSSPRHQ